MRGIFERAILPLLVALAGCGKDSVQSLDGLRGIEHVGADLIISNNALLPQSEVWAFTERMVAEGFAGAVIVQGNLDD